MMIQIIRQTEEGADRWGTEELEAALHPRVGRKLPLEGLAAEQSALRSSGRLAATSDLVPQRVRAVEAASTEEVGWVQAPPRG